MATTLLLDQSAWDLTLNSSGNWALASEPYSQAQDAASECRVFAGECYYDTTLGVPYFTDVLGLAQPTPILVKAIETAALRVPGVTQATPYLTVANGVMTGQILLSASGTTQAITL